MTDTPNYWDMPDGELASAWRRIDTAFQADANYYAEDASGERIETLNYIEDAILQRIGAPDFASGDEPKWQARIREYGRERDSEKVPA